MSDFLWPHRQQYTRLLCLPLSARVCSNSCPLSQRCYVTISSSAALFFFCPQSFPASGSFPMSRLFASGGQNIETSASPTVLPMIILGLFPLGLKWSTCSPRNSQHHNQKASIVWGLAFFMVQLSHPYMTTGKTTALTIRPFVGKVMSLLSNTLFMFVIASFPRSKHLLISWLHSLSALVLELKKIKSVTVSTFSPSICHEAMGLDTIILVFWMLSFKFKIPYHLYVDSKIWHKWTYLWNRNRPTDIENRLVIAKWQEAGEGWTGGLGLADANYYT